jgi:hypothetical protein
LLGTPDKTFTESKEKGKASKMKRREERKLKGLQAAQKENQKFKKRQGEN